MLKIKIILFILLASTTSAYTQVCSMRVEFVLLDASNNTVLNNANINVGENKLSSKPFVLQNICTGANNIIIAKDGYDSIIDTLNITADTVIIYKLTKRGSLLKEVTVVGTNKKKEELVSLTTASINGLALLQTRGNTLGESIKSIAGLNALQTGPGLSKPIIHGLHGNRVLILNNGIRQEGQQWGSEHAPEIDPFIAQKITIVKGAAGVRYGSDAIVGVILLEPKTLAPKTNIAGELNMVAATNGRLGALSAAVEGKLNKKLEGLAWRVQGTLKRAGNFKTANYFLNNTGLSETDFSLTTAYKKERYGIEFYYSKFFNKVAIFDGSHVGNINDLYEAFKRDKPITKNIFSYDINRTYQDIQHNLFKTSAYYKFKNSNKIEIVFATQNNKRDEYDVDLPYSTDPEILNKPQISFKINTQTLDLFYELHTKNNFSGAVGVSGSTQGNVFNGIRYLIPNFRNYTAGIFAIERYTKNNLTLEAGLRYDYRWLRAYQLNNTTLQPYNTTNIYKNITGTVGAVYKVNNNFSVNANVGSAWRAPSVNELYINGIHLSAASFEKGDTTLQSERSYNVTLSTKYENEKFSAEIVLYNNTINNFIYAKPSLQPVQLISGTYPFFKYTQNNVNLKGLDVDISYKICKQFTYTSKISLIRAWNKTINDYLIFMPADKFDNSIKYNIPIKGRLSNTYISVQNISVRTQNRVPPNSDYIAPPQGYSLFNIAAGFVTHIAKKELNVNIGIDNVTNLSYRDYLNRFRYYADDLGINAVIRTKINF